MTLSKMTSGPLTAVTVRYSVLEDGVVGVRCGSGAVESQVGRRVPNSTRKHERSRGYAPSRGSCRSFVAIAACSCTFAKSWDRPLISADRVSPDAPVRVAIGECRGLMKNKEPPRSKKHSRRSARRNLWLSFSSRLATHDSDGAQDDLLWRGTMDASRPAGLPTGKERYIKGAALGEGTFGVVTKAEDTVTHKIVAIKKIRLGKYKEGVNFTAIREIKLLQELRHPHVIELVDCFPHKRNLNLVFECCESDLEAVIKDKFLNLGTNAVKSYLQMTLKAVAYCHASWVLHRDLKPNNLLIAPNGALKLADFGLARVFGSPNRKFTHQVFARWYRAPELLLGSKVYGPGVDLWAVGCVFAELMLRKPFLPGSSDIDQLGRTYAALGTPTELTWPGEYFPFTTFRLPDCPHRLTLSFVSQGHAVLPDYMEFQSVRAPDLRLAFKTAPPDALDLLQKLLAFDPNRRLTAEGALAHKYFTTSPLATAFPDLPRPTHRFGDEGGGGDGGKSFPPPAGRDDDERRSPGAAAVGQRRGSGAMDTDGGGKRAKTAPRGGGANHFTHDRLHDSPNTEPNDGSGGNRRRAPHRNSDAMSTGGDCGHVTTGDGSSEFGSVGLDRPALSNVDAAYLRKRKLALDDAFLAASQEIEIDATE